jgi:hypothetical protein
MPGIERRHRVPVDALQRLRRTLRAAAVRVPRTVQQLRKGLHRPNRRIVLVLPQCGKRFRATLGELLLRKCRSPRHVHHDGKDVFEIVCKARAGQRHRVPRRSDPQRNAAFVQLLGDYIRGTLLRPSIDHPSRQICQARQLVRLIEAADQKGRVERHRGRRGRLLHDDDGTIVEGLSDRSQSARKCRRHHLGSTGRNHPTVRVADPRRRRATVQISSRVTASIRRCRAAR